MYVLKTKMRSVSTLPLLARSLAVSLPMPVLAPVIMTVLLSRRTEELHWPQKKFLELITEQMFIYHSEYLKWSSRWEWG